MLEAKAMTISGQPGLAKQAGHPLISKAMANEVAVTVFLSTFLATNWVTTHKLAPEKPEIPFGDYQPYLERQQGLVYRESWVRFPMGSNYLVSKDFVTNAGTRLITNCPALVPRWTNSAGWDPGIIIWDPDAGGNYRIKAR